jgi:hypothetical protein
LSQLFERSIAQRGNFEMVVRRIHPGEHPQMWGIATVGQYRHSPVDAILTAGLFQGAAGKDLGSGDSAR